MSDQQIQALRDINGSLTTLVSFVNGKSFERYRDNMDWNEQQTLNSVKTNILETSKLFPSGKWIPTVLENLERYLPVKIDECLYNAGVFMSTLGNPEGLTLIRSQLDSIKENMAIVRNKTIMDPQKDMESNIMDPQPLIDEARHQIYKRFNIIQEHKPWGLSVEGRHALEMLREALSEHLKKLPVSSKTVKGMTSWKSTLEDVIFKQFTKEMPGAENFMIEAVNKAIKSCLVFAKAIQIYRSKQEIASETNPAQTDMSCMVNGGDPLCVSNQYFVQTTHQRHT